jgi:putative exosortase-associated protein (TIGR04073 family)
MLKQISYLALAATTIALVSGCSNMERKFGRGISNSCEIVRMGELRRSMEQTSLFESPEVGYTTGLVKGINRTLGRTGLGLYEVVTFPFPPYHPVMTDTFAPGPVYPDTQPTGLPEDSAFATDSYVGFSGGKIAGFVPGNTFRVFEGP